MALPTVVYGLTPTQSGEWNETILYTFKDEPSAGFPYGALVSDAKGNVYGTTYYAGTNDLGTVYRLRYLNAGQLRDLERAIASMDEAIALTEPNAPGWGALLTTRGLLCLDAYNQTGLLASVNGRGETTNGEG